MMIGIRENQNSFNVECVVQAVNVSFYIAMNRLHQAQTVELVLTLRVQETNQQPQQALHLESRVV